MEYSAAPERFSGPRRAGGGKVQPEYLSLRALSAYASMSVRTLRKWLHHPARPLPHFRVGGKLFVRRSDYDSWMDGFRKETASHLDDIVRDVTKGL